MGVFGDGSNAKKKKRGVSDAGSVLDGLGTRKETRGKMSWNVVDPAAFHAVVCAVTRVGGMVSFGVARDGGALSVTVFYQEDRRTIWLNGDNDLHQELEKIEAVFLAL